MDTYLTSVTYNPSGKIIVVDHPTDSDKPNLTQEGLR